MGPGIPLVLAALGIIAFVTSTKGASAAPKGPTGPTGPVSPVRPEFKDIPLPLLQEMAKVIQDLTVTDFTTADSGAVTNAVIVGPVAIEAVQAATSLAAKLEQAGFPNAARTIRDLANLAAKKIPSPPDNKTIPLPTQCFTPEETTTINRLVAVERDPKKLQAVLDGLLTRAVPAECRAQVQVFIDMLRALIIQTQAKIDDEEAARRAEEELRKKDQTPGPLPPAPSPVNPNIPPQPPGPTPRVTIVQSGDGFILITRRLLGRGNDNRWVELRNRNVPQDADGRINQKDTEAKGGIKPPLRPGQKLFVPENWPALDSKPVNPSDPNKPPPVNPVIPPQPGGVTPKVTIVQSGDGFIRITRRLLGAGQDDRWRELRDANVPQDADGRKRSKDTDAKGGIKPQLQPNQKLFVPANWPVSGVPVNPTPSPVTPPFVPTPAPSTGKRITVVQSGDGFFRIAQRLGVDGNRWPELRDRNVPVDADGRSRQKDTAAKGGIKPQLNPGNKLFVPESWPASSAAVVQGHIDIGFAGEESFAPKSPVEIAAERMVSHLKRLQNKHPTNLEKVRNKSDKRLVARFQREVGLPVTSTVTPETLIKAAELGQVELPLVLNWPEGADINYVVSYRQKLFALAKAAEERGDARAVHELSESLKREKGQAAGLSAS